jgi:flagellar motor switch/type III secretory pathway protein FliN
MAETTTGDPQPSLELMRREVPLPRVGDMLMRAQWLPCRLVLETLVIDFTVASLMRLEPGAVVETKAQHNEDLPLLVNGQLVGTVKFDVTREKLAVRLTSIA